MSGVALGRGSVAVQAQALNLLTVTNKTLAVDFKESQPTMAPDIKNILVPGQSNNKVEDFPLIKLDGMFRDKVLELRKELPAVSLIKTETLYSLGLHLSL